jgi:uncharacterized membrane protein YhaH (DUF805 family)
MDREFLQRYVRASLLRPKFAMSLIVASILYVVIATGLGLNFGLKNTLLVFVPVTVVFVLFLLSLLIRRFNDGGLPGILYGGGALLVIGLVLIAGQFRVGLLALMLLFIVACAIPSRGAS